jgi:endogenous inhibitor of DNA gyrase (YacG/DUF329 family)
MKESLRQRACPVCRKAVAPAAENPAFPLCSARCKSVDLGRWLSESYRIPEESVELEDQSSPDVFRSEEDLDA